MRFVKPENTKEKNTNHYFMDWKYILQWWKEIKDNVLYVSLYVLQRNTFQLFLATDHHNSYVVYVYQDQAMKWSPTGYK